MQHKVEFVGCILHGLEIGLKADLKMGKSNFHDY